MNKSYIIFILIISLNFNANSQDFTKIDSLKNLLKTSNKEEKAKILNSLAFRYHTIDYNIGLEYAKQSLKISNELKNNKLIILAYNVLVTNYWAKSELDSAMLFAKKALELSYVLKDSAFISDAYFNIALINSSESKYNIAIKYYDTSYNYVPDKNLFSKISIEINRGVSNYNLTNYKEALKSFLIATKYYEANKFKENLPYTYDLLGNIYIATGEKELGLDYLKKALKISRELKYIVSEGTALQSIASYYETKEIYDSSLIYLKQALVLSIKTGHNIMTIDIYASIGDSYIKRGQIDSAKFYYNTVLDLAEKNDDNWAKVSGYKGIADVFLKQKKYRKAIKNYEKAEVIALQINSKEVLKDIYENLAKAYKAANKFKNACLIQEKYIKIADSLYNEESAKQLSNMKIIYETDKKEQENAKLKVENKLNEKTIENQKILNIAILIVFILSAILIVALILYSRKIKNTNSRLLYKNEQIHQQKEEITIQSENLERAYSNLKELENFKQGLIGMIVHDLKNPLNIVINMSDNEFIIDSGYKMLNMVNNILDVEKYDEIKMPINLENINLRDLVEKSITKNNFLAKLQDIKIENNIEKAIKINVDKEILERIFDNLLTNAIKFSPKDEKISIDAKIENNFISVSVSDCGIGIPDEFKDSIFDKFVQAQAKNSGVIRSTGLGLTFCKLAVESHGGKISFISDYENKGTTFTFTIPISL